MRKRDELDHLLRSLPRETASEAFTRQVVTRVTTGDMPPPGRRAAFRFAMAAAGLVLVLSSVTVQRWQENRERQEARRKVEQMRDEYRVLERELRDLMRLAAESQPLVRVGETEEFDFVVDLRDFTAGPGGLAEPVAYRPRLPE